MTATDVWPMTKTTGFGQLPELIERGMGAPTLQNPTYFWQLLDIGKPVFDLFDNSGRITDNKTFDMSLGYLERVNFTRAFNRWQGCSSSSYRT